MWLACSRVDVAVYISRDTPFVEAPREEDQPRNTDRDGDRMVRKNRLEIGVQM